jgi:hypothetical protein
MIIDAPWNVPNKVLWQDLQITSVKEKNPQIRHPVQEPPLHTSQQPHSSPHGSIRPQATETTSVHRSAHQISCVNVVLDIVVLVMSFVSGVGIVAIVGYHGNSVYRAVAWIPIWVTCGRFPRKAPILVLYYVVLDISIIHPRPTRLIP